MSAPPPPPTTRVGAPGPGPKPAVRRQRSGWALTARTAGDALALLAVAVMVAHAFLVEGYVISSGSMAPGLFGYHKRVVCPSCAHSFARGINFDGVAGLPGRMTAGEGDEAPTRPVTFAHCPNCGQPEIDVTAAPDTQGDQLLVLKHAFAWRDPRRWEVVVFRHPEDARQAYVKRVVGLPGEAVRVSGGDVWADGELCRKPLVTQRAVRIPVYDPAFAPRPDEAPEPRWSGDGWVREELRDGDAPTVRFATAEFDAPPAADAPAADDVPAADDAAPADEGESRGGWRRLTYRHVLAAGGTHETAVTIDPPPRRFTWDEPRLPVAYDFDPITNTLSCRGVLSGADACRLRRLSRDPRWRDAVQELADRSQFAPITDDYGYNHAPDPRFEARVRDFAASLSADLSRDADAALALQLTDGHRTFLLVADRADRERRPTGTLSLFELDAVGHPIGAALRSVALPAAVAAGPVSFEFSLFDRQAVAAVDGVQPFAPVLFERPEDAPPPGASPALVGGRGAVAVTELMLYRDVHYTRGRAVHGVEEDYRLGEGELFVLGDNSPVSLDSRGWSDGAVPERLLVGKPFIVHLPSKPGTLSWGDSSTTVRIPDPARIRYVR
ncbi:signal peptidase I [Alienimonas californiensis]|uniref:Signal peptidase I n=1 Tax=Alienimonas californiensis TaxID=2527989 RepID=A0A517P8L4_9PLAN|nr:signal peptidase I [Alienimonas californiensis]QDT15712.1 signal peptidase I [Alienimonas californiensis]